MNAGARRCLARRGAESPGEAWCDMADVVGWGEHRRGKAWPDLVRSGAAVEAWWVLVGRGPA
jgi:hypothetical protein